MNDGYRYFNDEELEQLIAQVEEKGLISAPVYLKEALIQQLPAQQIVSKPSLERQKVTFWGSSPAARALLLYSVKVVTGAAAAILILLAVPINAKMGPVMQNIQNWQIEREAESYLRDKEAAIQRDRDEGSQILKFVNEKSSQVCEALNGLSYWLIREEKNYD